MKKLLAALIAAAVLTVPLTLTATAQVASAGRCYDYEPALRRYSPGWSVLRMSRYMYRESRCHPKVRSASNDSGLLQINDVNHPYLRDALDEWVDRYTLLKPGQNVRAAAALCRYWREVGRGCYYPWGG